MACCTTITAPMNAGQKRSSGGIFDLPRTSKRRRPFASTMTTTSTSMSPSTAFLTANKPVIIDASSDKAASSVFKSVPFDVASSSVYGVAPSSSSSAAASGNGVDENSPIMTRIRDEAKRLMRRRQLTIASTTTTTTTSTTSPATAPGSMEHASLSHKSHSSSSMFDASAKPSASPKPSTQYASSHNDVPLFSMNQVNMICERMLKEREQSLREQYDKILTQKLSEQYDAFVKFTHEQIQRRFESSQCSYVS